MSRTLLVISLLVIGLLSGCGQDESGPPAVGTAPEESPPPQPYADVPWGEAVNGLVLAVEAPQATYAKGEAMRLTVRAKNVSGGPLKLSAFEDHMWWYRLFFEFQGDGPDFQAANTELLDFESPPDLTLGDGEVWTKELKLTEEGRFLRVIPNRKPGDDWDYREELPAGSWRAWLEYDGGLKGRAGFWTGRVRSNVLEIEVRAAP